MGARVRIALGATTLLISLGCVTAVPVSAAPAHRARSKLGPRVSVVVTSANLHQALSRAAGATFTGGRAPALPTVQISDSARYQTVRSVGGAMTDSSAWLIQTGLTPATRAWLMRRLFGRGGLHLGLMRIPMGASDFTATGDALHL